MTLHFFNSHGQTFQKFFKKENFYGLIIYVGDKSYIPRKKEEIAEPVLHFDKEKLQNAVEFLQTCNGTVIYDEKGSRL